MISRIFSTLALAGLLAGCATTRQEKSAQTASTMEDLSLLLTKSTEQAGKLQNAAEYLATVNSDGLRQAYDRFAKEATELRSIAAKTLSVNESLGKKAKDYFANWEKELGEISNSDLKTMSRDRQTLLQQQYSELSTAMDEWNKVYMGYEKNLADLEKFLGNDLTQVGSEFAKPYLEKLASDTESFKGATQKTEATVSRLGDVLKPK